MLVAPAATNGVASAHESTAALAQAIGGEPIAEVARRTLRRFFDKLLAREDAVRKGEDIEDVHQMRVATRRLRASLQVTAGVYDPKLIQRYRRGLRRIALSLGAVRDGDVFLEHVTAYQSGLPEAGRAQLDPLIAAVSAERAQARKQLLADLHSKRYHKLKRDFAAFLTTPGAGLGEPPELGIVERVRDFAGSAIWRRYELWRAYEVVLPNATSETLHQARIAGKRFRYTLEFFADALGPNVEQALTPLIALQENLGALQDGVTARAHVATLGLADDPGTQAYLAAREHDRDALLAELPRLWEKVASATYRRRLFEMIVKL
jgi:CHAD domain-containing protein